MPESVAQKASQDIMRVLEWCRESVTKAAFMEGSDWNVVELERVHSMLSACYRRWLPSPDYFSALQQFHPASQIAYLYGRLEALKSDYDFGNVQTVQELIHGDVFTDFLEMAEHLLESGFKDAAAVIIGSTLEEHIRKLCGKHNASVNRDDGKPKSLDAMNHELKSKDAYTLNENKMVTAWAGLRNSAAHGKYDEYRHEDVKHMLQAVKLFFSKYPA